MSISIIPQARQDLRVSLRGASLLHHPMLNQGSAFSEADRRDFGLLGLLPPHVATMEEQLSRAYENYRREQSPLERHLFLQSLRDRNEVLYFRLVLEHIEEMMPIIYTPVVGEACQRYSHLYRTPRGLYLDYPHRDQMDVMLRHAPNASRVRIIVVTDGERILGLGDLGVGGMGIPVGKLALYTLCAGIHPAATLPIVLDVGTDNQALLDDPLYLGWRHERLRGEAYDRFIDQFVEAVTRAFPGTLLQWEDFAKQNASRLVARYRNRLCTFNDDIQGTGAVTLAGITAALAASGARLRDQRAVLFGAGSAAYGISDQIVAAMTAEGLSAAEGRSRLWLLDSQGLVHNGREGLGGFKLTHAQPVERVSAWQVADPSHITLAEVVRHVHPTILVGTSTMPGSFSEEIVREMARHTARPLIFPLSNPTSRCEASPEDLLRWTGGTALVATGSPFQDVRLDGRRYVIGQCNNAYIFPGVGLGLLASGAPHVTDAMFVAAARALSEFAPVRHDPTASLYPPLTGIRAVSRAVALAVAVEAQQSGLAEAIPQETLAARVDALVWEPDYPRLVPV